MLCPCIIISNSYGIIIVVTFIFHFTILIVLKNSNDAVQCSSPQASAQRNSFGPIVAVFSHTQPSHMCTLYTPPPSCTVIIIIAGFTLCTHNIYTRRSNKYTHYTHIIHTQIRIYSSGVCECTSPTGFSGRMHTQNPLGGRTGTHTYIYIYYDPINRIKPYGRLMGRGWLVEHTHIEHRT